MQSVIFLIFSVFPFLLSDQVPVQPMTSSGIFHVLRLKPGQDLKKEILAYAGSRQILAGGVVSCTGSLTTTVLRLAGKSDLTTFPGKQEIVSLTGTFSSTGGHFHLSVSDSTGKTTGGHLADGCLVYTTAELILVELPELVFRRQMDSLTGYPELVPSKK